MTVRSLYLFAVIALAIALAITLAITLITAYAVPRRDMQSVLGSCGGKVTVDADTGYAVAYELNCDRTYFEIAYIHSGDKPQLGPNGEAMCLVNGWRWPARKIEEGIACYIEDLPRYAAPPWPGYRGSSWPATIGQWQGASTGHQNHEKDAPQNADPPSPNEIESQP